jgi:hypothetical protein
MLTLSLNEPADQAGLTRVGVADYDEVDLLLAQLLLLLH